jgi:hypothetical protein
VIDGTSWLLVRDVVKGVAADTLSGIETSDGLSRLDLANRAAEADDQAEMDALEADLAKLEAETTGVPCRPRGPNPEGGGGRCAREEGRRRHRMVCEPEGPSERVQVRTPAPHCWPT